jgi:hypothetical protein
MPRVYIQNPGRLLPELGITTDEPKGEPMTTEEVIKFFAHRLAEKGPSQRHRRRRKSKRIKPKGDSP